MSRKLLIAIGIIAALVAGWYFGFRHQVSPATGLAYRNNTFGLLIPLPNSWKGYTVNQIKEDIRDVTGTTTTNNGVVSSFQLIEIHYPGESAQNPHEVMPIMVFTPAQWSHIQNEEWSVGAAPIPPSKLGQNSKYILALPARYNYDYKPGWEEVDQLVHQLQAFEPTPTTSCIPRPACLDSTPRCYPPEPIGGWCK